MSPEKIIFVGAGPGDPELITVRGAKALAAADLVVYAGSLAPPEMLSLARPDAEAIDSSRLTLEETHEFIKSRALAGKKVVRLHSGDPTLYGALAEQIALLERDNLPWGVVPGVTAACAAAAQAGISLTLPEASQSVIITRAPGRTPMPENLAELARAGCAMTIYLGGGRAKEIQTRLLEALEPRTPVLCVRDAGRENAIQVWTTLGELAESVAENDLTARTIFLVLPGELKKGARSRLYAKEFGHGYRPAADD